MELSELSSVRSTEVEGLETELVSPVYPEKRTFNVNQLRGLTPINQLNQLNVWIVNSILNQCIQKYLQRKYFTIQLTGI